MLIAAVHRKKRCVMFSIGEFSKITGMPIKTLRFYHEKEILIPSCVDPTSGYRYYDRKNIEKARVIASLRAWEFSLKEIKEILDNYDDQADILDYLERHKTTINAKIRQHRNIIVTLDKIITCEREAMQAMQESIFKVQEKTLEPMLIAGVRMKGRYSDCGRVFGRIGRKMGRYLCGKPMNLYYDGEYREEDADFEPCFPVSKALETEDIAIRELPGGSCVTLLHKGPYEELGRSYALILEYIREKGYEAILPTREVYLKGPGMILKGNPKNYLTEIQIMINR